MNQPARLPQHPAPSVFVFGAGPAGLATARALLARGARVVVGSRRRPAALPTGALHVVVDATDAAAAAAVVHAADASVVVAALNAPYTRWPTDFPPLQRAVVAACAAHGRHRAARGLSKVRLVVLDNLYALSPSTTPLTESSPRAPTTVKGRVRLQMDEELWRAHHAGAVDVVVGRASDFFGPDVAESGLGARQLDRLLTGGTAEIAGDPEAQHNFSFIDDVGRGLAVLCLADGAVGRSFHLPVMPPRTLRAVVDDVAGRVGAAPKLRVLSPTTTARLARVVPIVREVHEMRYQWDRDFLVDDGAFFAAFGESFGARTSWDQALAQTLAGRRAAVAAAAAARRGRLRAVAAAFVVDNLWIGALGMLALAVTAGVGLADKAAFMAVALGLYQAPRLRALTLRLAGRARSLVRPAPARALKPVAPLAAVGLALVPVLALASACSGAPSLLSETGLYDDESVRPFTPRFTLWSDGFEKSRFVALPAGGVIDNRDDDAWVFPVGTRFWKEFKAEGKKFETRYLEKTADNTWVAASYIWNDDESEATLASFLGQTAVRGTAHDAPWAPSCTFCHGDAELPLGFTAVQLSRGDDGLADDEDPAGAWNLSRLAAAGALSEAPQPVQLPEDPVARAALGVLHANCGSCHSQSGSQNDLPLRLRLKTNDADLAGTGVFRTAVGHDATDAIDGRLVYLNPGAPDDSLIVHRMSSRGNAAMMPPTGTKVVDEEGVAAVRAFVLSLEP